MSASGPWNPEKWTSGYGTVVTQCVYCKHRSRMGLGCKAFPGGIPDEIVANLHDHRKPYLDPESGEPLDLGISSDTSILFEPADGVTPQALKPLFAALDQLPR